MRRTLAPFLAALALLCAARASAEPLDFDLAKLGAPDPAVWRRIGSELGLPAGSYDADLLARDARQRFAVLSSETALALSSPLLQPASTTGHSGFAFDLEGAVVAVHPDAIGTATFPSSPAFGPRSPWQTRSLRPSELFLPSFHVRKALPFSFELGGRMIYLSQSSLFAGQLEAKWALNEGFDVLPDIGVRLAYTELFGHRDWNLGTLGLDLLVSKRWGVNGVTSFTPYAAARFTYVNASSERMDFSPELDPTRPVPAVHDEHALFPTLRAGFYRTTVGLRFTAYLVSLAAELTYFGGATKDGGEAFSEYPEFGLASSWGGAFKFGWEF
jgi:hypothetical protein